MPAVRKDSRKPAPAPAVRIVGVGASAGGLEALDQFLRNIPIGSGLAVVVVQHLDPTKKGMMVELLQRATPMRVAQVRDGMKLEPDRVYVIPPNKEMSTLHGTLYLMAPTRPRGQRLPIDSFFRSLAEDQRERAAGVVLSGMGSDGTEGLKAIKDKGGTVFVQAPDSAQFDAMPRSAIEAGLGDLVATPAELGAEIANRLKSPSASSGHPDKSQGALEKIFILLRTQTGHDFSLYKKSTVRRRIERRMGVHQLADIGSYVRLLQGNAQEAELLFKELLIGVTEFFRDPTAWEAMADQGIPALLGGRDPGRAIRAWVPACSTGEEAYSLAIALHEAFDRVPAPNYRPVQIFATDLDKDAVEKARQGLYSAAAVRGVSPERLERFFVPVGTRFQVSRSIRESVVFAPHNVVMDPPFTRIDILSCRNLLVYLMPELQQKLMSLFHYSLASGGILFLGSAESVSGNPDLFTPLAGPARIYRRVDRVSAARPDPEDGAHLLSAHLRGRDRTVAARPEPPKPSLQSFADRLVLQRFVPACVLTNDKGDIVYIAGRTGRYLEPASGKVNWNVLAMAREGLVHELGRAFRKAVRDDATVTFCATLVGSEAHHAVNVTIEPISEPEALRGTVMIVFSDAPAPAAAGRRSSPKRAAEPGTAALAELEQELKRARSEAGANREEMQSWLEELTSSNEELQSTNEELQSTNEELTTSREELQSLNEEMQTLNSELQAKVDELSRAENDMRNLLDSTDIATLFVDTSLNVRRFTSTMTRLINLIPGDTGRPITDLATDLIYPELAEDAREVLRTLRSNERSVATGDGRWFTARVMPYRTLDNRIDGVVITFTDITAAKQLEATLRARTAPGGDGGS